MVLVVSMMGCSNLSEPVVPEPTVDEPSEGEPTTDATENEPTGSTDTGSSFPRASLGEDCETNDDCDVDLVCHLRTCTLACDGPDSSPCDRTGDGSDDGFCAAGACVECVQAKHCEDYPTDFASCFDTTCKANTCAYAPQQGKTCNPGDCGRCDAAGDCLSPGGASTCGYFGCASLNGTDVLGEPQAVLDINADRFCFEMGYVAAYSKVGSISGCCIFDESEYVSWDGTRWVETPSGSAGSGCVLAQLAEVTCVTP